VRCYVIGYYAKGLQGVMMHEANFPQMMINVMLSAVLRCNQQELDIVGVRQININ